MKSQRIPEHKLNSTVTVDEVIENNENKGSSMPVLSERMKQEKTIQMKQNNLG